MRKLIPMLMAIFTILVWSSAFADTTSNPDNSTPRHKAGVSDAYWYAHAAGIMHSLVKGNANLTYADVVSLIKSK
jgi:hypothetical protein